MSFALLATLFFLLALSHTVAAEENHVPELQGNSTLTIHSIDQSHEVPATWELWISASNKIGADFLPDPHMGVRYQIDNHIGDGDGNISQSESLAFSTQLEQSRSWGCRDSRLLFIRSSIIHARWPHVIQFFHYTSWAH